MNSQSPVVHTPSPRRRWLRVGSAAGISALVLTALVAGPAQASHDVSLAGSDFEIDVDANLTTEHDELPTDDEFYNADTLDWGIVPDTKKADGPSGSGDDAFGQGSKEDTPEPSVVSGGIPPNKSDLKTFGVYLEATDGDDFLHLFWHRVQDPSGTTNMDFEFNQGEALSSNGVTPLRVEGDLLIQYDLANGGTHPELFLSEWVTTGNKSLCEAANSTPCWGDRVNLTSSGLATGSINTTAISDANSDGLGSISARTFGEATVNFTALTDEVCSPFGSAYLKSRSSDSFTAAMKDFIAPQTLNLDNCGALVIEKTRKHAADGSGDHPHEGVTLTVSSDLLEENVDLITNGDGEACLDSLESGDYTVTESVIPEGYAVTSDNPQTWTVVEGTDCDSPPMLTFTNMPLTDITVSVNSQVDGGTFSSIECAYTDDDPDVPFPVVVPEETPPNGDATLPMTDLLPGEYTCVIVVDP